LLGARSDEHGPDFGFEISELQKGRRKNAEMGEGRSPKKANRKWQMAKAEAESKDCKVMFAAVCRRAATLRVDPPSSDFFHHRAHFGNEIGLRFCAAHRPVI